MIFFEVEVFPPNQEHGFEQDYGGGYQEESAGNEEYGNIIYIIQLLLYVGLCILPHTSNVQESVTIVGPSKVFYLLI